MASPTHGHECEEAREKAKQARLAATVHEAAKSRDTTERQKKKHPPPKLLNGLRCKCSRAVALLQRNPRQARERDLLLLLAQLQAMLATAEGTAAFENFLGVASALGK